MFPTRTRAARLRLDTLESRVTPATNFIASGAAAGGLPLVQLARPDGSVLAQFQAFEASFAGGVRAAAGELDGNPGTVEVAAAAGPGGGPRVRVVSVDTTTGATSDFADFFAYEPTFRDGVRVAVGSVGTPGGLSDRQNLIVGAEQGGGPRVRVLRLDDGGNAAPIAGPLGDFFAYEPSFRGGVRVAAGELDGNLDDGDELLVAAGPGGGPRVQVLRGDGAVLADFFAFRPDFLGGVNVGVDTAAGSTTGTPRIDALADDFSQRLASLNAAAAVSTNTRVTGVGAPPNVAGVDADTVLRLANAGILSPSDFNALVTSNPALFANGGLTGTGSLNANTIQLLANAGAISNANLNAIVAANPNLFTAGGFTGVGTSGTSTSGLGTTGTGLGTSGFGTSGAGLGTTGVGLGGTGFGTSGFGTTGAGLGTTGVGLGGTGFGTSGFGTTGAGFGTTGVGLGGTGFGTTGFGTTGLGGTGLSGTGFNNAGFGSAGVGTGLAGLGLGGTGFNPGLLFGANGLATSFPFNGSSVFAANPGAPTTFPTLASPTFASGFFGSAAGSTITTTGAPVTAA